MTVVKHPNGSRLHVSDDSVDLYLRAGWAKVEPAKPAADPAPQQDKQPAAKRRNK